MDKEIYINNQVDNDFIIKSKNSSLAFAFVAIIYSISFPINVYRPSVIVLCLISILINAWRIYLVERYVQNKNSISKSVRLLSIAVLLNGLCWSSVGMLSVISFQVMNLNILVTFILLLAFIAGSIVTISGYTKILIVFNSLMFTPILFHSINLTIKQRDPDAIILAIFCIINIFYTFKQARVIKNEMLRRFSSEFDLKKSLEELEISKKNLEQESVKTFHASRLSSLGEMAGGVAHEINNPLTIIQGMSNSLLMKDPELLDENIKNKLNKILSASDRIAKIVRSMKMISSRSDNNSHDVIEVEKILSISTDLFEERIKSEQIQFQIINNLNPTVYCNPLQVSQIIINLLSNALDALQTYEGEKKILLSVEQRNSYVVIRVSNTGSPLSETIKSKMFEPFFTTKALGKGTGLGLSISRTLAMNNNGSLEYEHYENMNAFTLCLKGSLKN